MVLQKLMVALTLLATPVTAAEYQPLFDGRSLDGWTPVGGATWTLKDGIAAADKGGMGFLVSKGRFADYELRVEFWVSGDANSGVFIRCGDPTNITFENCYEVNIYDTRPDPAYGTGGIVNVASVSPMPRTGGRWNVMLIRAEQDRLTVELNGQRTVDSVRDARLNEGHIALQYGAGVVKFRKVEIRPL